MIPEVVELLIDGKSGDLELERRKAKEIAAIWPEFKKMRNLNGTDLLMFLVPAGPPGQRMKEDLRQSNSPCRTQTPNPWPSNEGPQKPSHSL